MSNAEKLAEAEKYLKGQGLTVLDRNYTSTDGTADIIAADKGELVVVALVARILDTMSETGKKRLRRIAVNWLNHHGIRYDRVRVDLVALRLEGTGGYTIEHARGIG